MKPKIGITIGDINGIGPEIIIKMLSDDRIYALCQPIIYGSTKVLSYYKKMLKNEKFKYTHLKDWGRLAGKQTFVVNCIDEQPEINVGKETDNGGKYAFESLNTALKDWKDGKIDALLTAPINKSLVAKHAGENFKGHTEYITTFCEKDESLMLLTSDRLTVGLATNHIPVNQIASSLKPNLITKKIMMLNKSLKEDFNIQKPKIAVLGLNPHAGDNGLLGSEEENIIKPAIQDANSRGILTFGPYPSDGFFGTLDYTAFDGILAMYHDQGLIPFKALAFDEGVNFTSGLNLVRTSPDHGTAYNIAGKNTASEQSMRQALFLAIDIVKNRMNNK
ncbi:MAG: 4-hydroxythreonine-4-phosphate dehydrogenase PdxA [Chitinophagales bacterium]